MKEIKKQIILRNILRSGTAMLQSRTKKILRLFMVSKSYKTFNLLRPYLKVGMSTALPFT